MRKKLCREQIDIKNNLEGRHKHIGITPIHAQTQPDTHTHRHTDTRSHRQRFIHKHPHTHTHIHTQRHTPALTPTHRQDAIDLSEAADSLSLTLSLSLFLFLSLSLFLSPSKIFLPFSLPFPFLFPPLPVLCPAIQWDTDGHLQLHGSAQWKTEQRPPISMKHHSCLTVIVSYSAPNTPDRNNTFYRAKHTRGAQQPPPFSFFFTHSTGGEIMEGKEIMHWVHTFHHFHQQRGWKRKAASYQIRVICQ